MDNAKTFPERQRLTHTSKPEGSKPMDFINDEEINRLYFDRDEAAIAETQRKYGKYLKKIAADMTDDKRDAEECVNDVYLSAWNSIPPNRPDSLKAYLTALVRRAAADVYRRNGRDKRIPENLYSPLDELADILPGDSAEDELDGKVLSDVIKSFVSSLPERKKYIFISRYYVNRKTIEIAKKLNVSRSTVAKELSQIKADLKKRLDLEGYNI
ncbi:MAG: sigma-70 family RNA polymerase sigma factor [Clostridia bacterium]|nr:sigma-70 family RNA polymerase sigma factor [Clostridia bacterium]